MSLASDVESILRSTGTPYISVDEAKKALFAGQKLDSFHFVVYFPKGRNWLLQCGERRREKLAGMREWEGIFGDGFRGVFAVRRAGGIQFTDIDGKPIDFEDGNQPGAKETRVSIAGGVAVPPESSASSLLVGDVSAAPRGYSRTNELPAVRRRDYQLALFGGML
jgi:hypothetical protein